jgi:hypothetical protein
VPNPVVNLEEKKRFGYRLPLFLFLRRGLFIILKEGNYNDKNTS